MSQKIRIKLKSYDHTLLDKSAEKIVKTVKASGAVVSGPIPLPTHKRIFKWRTLKLCTCCKVILCNHHSLRVHHLRSLLITSSTMRLT